jgi:hypothetical protein
MKKLFFGLLWVALSTGVFDQGAKKKRVISKSEH